MQTSIGWIAGMGRALRIAGLVMAFTAVSVSAQVNSWVNPSSGNWDDAASWSLGALPSSAEAVLITNSLWKAVSINPSTPVSFPDCMTVSNLTIRGAWDTENTLLLNYFGTGVPLTVLNGLTVADGGRIVNYDSGLVVQGGTITVTNAQLIQDGGYVGTTSATMYLQGAEYDLTNGLFEAGQVQLGLPVRAQFNQYGGRAVISDLVFGRGVASAGGSYSLYGGDLSLPNGLTLLGGNNAISSYFQAGGTNRTTEVYMEPDLYGSAPSFTLSGGLLADNDVRILGDAFGSPTLNQNGGLHVVTNWLSIAGGAHSMTEVHPATYRLNGGTLSAGGIALDATEGDAVFVQSNGLAQVQDIGAAGAWIWKSDVTLAGGTMTCTNLALTNGANLHQYGGELVVSNALGLGGYRQPGPLIYSRFEFLGGTLTASNLNVGGDWIIGDSAGTNRISNPGTCSLWHTLLISNAVEQLGRFNLPSNAVINLAGSASRLSFAKSSGEAWAGGATLVISNWNGNLSGGGAEQLSFGTDGSGLTAAQLSQIQFRYGSALYPARILDSGEVVPDQVVRVSVAVSQQGSHLVLSWPGGWSLQSATNVPGPYVDVQGATSPYTNDMSLEPQRFFRLRLLAN